MCLCLAHELLSHTRYFPDNPMIVCNLRNSTECKDCSCAKKRFKSCLGPQSILYLDLWLSETNPPYGDAVSIPVQSFAYFCINWNVSKNNYMICAWAKQSMISEFTLTSSMLPCLSDGLKECIIYCTISINLAVTWLFAFSINPKQSGKSRKIKYGVKKKKGCYVLLLNWLK